MTLPPPPDALEACVVVPARDEEALVGACIAALAAQRDVERDAVEVILVLDRCTDATATRAREAALAGGVRLHVVDAPADGVGHARRHGMDLACARLFAAGRPHGLIATTRRARRRPRRAPSVLGRLARPHRRHLRGDRRPGAA